MESPPLRGLSAAAEECREVYRHVVTDRSLANREGGDVAASGSARSLLRHVANYLAAAELAEQRGPVGPVVDVGSGVGALGVWLARRLDADLLLVDADPHVRRVAAASFPDVTVQASLEEVPPASAGLVTAMEVIEHVEHAGQLGFVKSLAACVRPGGLLVVSTPDESRYLGGWSGYAPHIGVLDADGLHTLLTESTGWDTVVWRLEGQPFALGPLRRVLEPLANRAWTVLNRFAGGLAQRLASRQGAARARVPSPLPAVSVRAVPPEAGSGTGLIAVATAPHEH